MAKRIRNRKAEPAYSVGLGPDKPLIPPGKCAGLPGKPCENLTRNRRCEDCKPIWDRMHDVTPSHYHGDEYGGGTAGRQGL